MIRGILPALLTPMDDDGTSVNHESLRRLVEFHIRSGASGFFVCGGTGEGLLLNPQERREVLATVMAAAGGRAKVIAHIGASLARMELRKLQHLSEEQLDAVQEWRDERLEHSDAAEEPASPGRSRIDELLSVRAADLVEHIHRVLTHARALESSIDSAVQLHFSATAFRTAEIMRVLTVLTAIFMPLTLITSIFGMNFHAMPWVDRPQGFWLMLAAMGLIVLVMLVVFTTRRYLEAPLPRRVGRRKGDPPVAGDVLDDAPTLIDAAPR